jgi:hypothetical protein
MKCKCIRCKANNDKQSLIKENKDTIFTGLWEGWVNPLQHAHTCSIILTSFGITSQIIYLESAIDAPLPCV